MRKTRIFVQLDEYKRDRIEALLDQGVEKQEIAKIIGVHKSTITREIQKRSKINGEYKASSAEHKALVARSNSKYQGMKIEKHPELRKFIISELKKLQSPDGIAGRMKEEKLEVRVSADAIYRWLRSAQGARYCKYLCTKRYRKKPHSDAPKRQIIPNMVSIHSVPPDPGLVTEGDTFLSPKKISKTSAILVGWRDSKLLKGDIIKSLRPIHTTKVMRKIHLENKSDLMILDQGGENREHEKFGVLTCFCDPASPRQKPFIESSIGLCRRWFWPKGTNLRKVSKQEFQEKLEILNNKYRKTLRYRSANEVSRECGIILVN
jgi:IS30 family transposase